MLAGHYIKQETLLGRGTIHSSVFGIYIFQKGIYNVTYEVKYIKDYREEIFRVGTLDIERSQLPAISPYPWQSDTCIGEWVYNARIKYSSILHKAVACIR